MRACMYVCTYNIIQYIYIYLYMYVFIYIYMYLPEKGGTKARGAQGAEAGKVYGGGGRRSAGRKVRRI